MNSSASSRQIPVHVHLVHGTWAYGLPLARCWFRGFRARKSRLWFQPASRFRRSLQENVDVPLHFIHFRWSGRNSFLARQQAAVEFSEHLARCIRLAPNVPHFVIAHSHGGTVAFEAIFNSNFKWVDNIAGVLSMATPFVSLAPRPQGRRALFLPLFGPIALLAAWLAVYSSDDFLVRLWDFGVDLSILSALVLTVLLLDSPLTEKILSTLEGLYPKVFQIENYEQRLSQVLGCPWLAIRAPGDEASLTIGLAQCVEMFAKLVHTVLVAAPLNVISRCAKGFLRRVYRPFDAALRRAVHRRFAKYLPIAEFALPLLLTGGAIALGADKALDRFIIGSVVAMVGSGVIFICLGLLSGAIWLLPTLCLALATGPEVLLFLGKMSCIAEAQPRCSPKSRIVTQYVWPKSNNSGGFVHTMHQSPEVVAVVAQWIRSARQEGRV